MPEPERPTRAGLAAGRDEVDAVDRGHIRLVMEMHAGEAELALVHLQRRGVGPVGDGARLVDRGVIAHEGGDPLLHHGVEVAERRHRMRGKAERGDEAGEIADRAAAVEDAPADQHEDAGDRDAGAGLEERIEAPRALTAFILSRRTSSKAVVARAFRV